MKKIICIDDDPISLMYCTNVFRKSNFATEILTAKDGQEALDYFENLVKSSEEESMNSPELIFLDLNMPIMNGWEFLDEFVKKYSHQFPITKVVILSSSIDPLDLERSKSYSICEAFLAKPLTVVALKDLQDFLV